MAQIASFKACIDITNMHRRCFEEHQVLLSSNLVLLSVRISVLLNSVCLFFLIVSKLAEWRPKYAMARSDLTTLKVANSSLPQDQGRAVLYKVLAHNMCVC